MLTWVVIFRRTLRRSSLLPSPKSLPLNSFADPHPLTPVPSILYKKHGGRGGHISSTFRPSDRSSGSRGAEIPTRLGRMDVTTCSRSIPFLFTHLRIADFASPFL